MWNIDGSGGQGSSCAFVQRPDFFQAENMGFRFSNRKIQFKCVLFSTMINDT